MTPLSVSEQLVQFMRNWIARGLPDAVIHEANRLLINQIKASIGATDHPAVTILHQWAKTTGTQAGQANVLWLGDRLAAEQACVVNAALFEVLDFNETHIPTFQHAVSGVLPAVMAVAQMQGSRGYQVLEALAIGIEVELALAKILMPTGYYRGFIPGGITGAIGGAAGSSLLLGLDDVQTRNALGLAMNCGMGFYHSAGSMALPYVMGMTARNGMTAARLASAGLDASAEAFEGDKGMLSSYSDESPDKIAPILGELGSTWRIFDQSYKTVPTETITHAPIECVMNVLPRTGGRKVDRMRLGVSDIVVTIAEERAGRFGAPQNDLEAKFDLKHCVAATWIYERFTLSEMQEPAFTNPNVLDLRSRIDLVGDSAHPTFEGATLRVDFTDGTSETAKVPQFRGTPGNPLSDDELSDLVRTSAAGILSTAHSDTLLEAAWGLPDAPDIEHLIAQLNIEKERP